MKRYFLFIVLALVGLMFAGSTIVSAQKKAKKEAILWAAENIKWEAMKDAPPGTMGAALWGDMTKGAYGSLVKFPANTKHPLHTHAYDIKTVIVSGTFTYAPEGGVEKSYGPGSYLLIPANVKHLSGSGPDGVTFFMEQTGKFDMKAVEAK
jgi:quercetin dioxygenase-like cupin family protein